MSVPPIPNAFKFPLLFIILLLLTACGDVVNTPTSEIPLVPVEYATIDGGVVPWRAPLHVRDNQLQLAKYGPEGDRSMELYDEVTFPTDVLVVYSEGDDTISVFLRRSPHGGCLLLWEPDTSTIHDPCFGSKFDQSGAYISGPAPRSLDRLPATIRDGIVWIEAEVIYGDPHP